MLRIFKISIPSDITCRNKPSPFAAGQRLVSGLLVSACLLTATACSTPRATPLHTGTPGGRLQDRELQRTLIGALGWLEDNQVRDRPGRGSSRRDLFSGTEGSRSILKVNPSILPDFDMRAPKSMPQRNQGGEWVSEIHFLPGRWTLNDRSVGAVLDSNLFSTASTALPLALFDDGSLPQGQRFVTAMLQQAHSCAQQFRRGNGYSFWTRLPPVEGRVPRIGPLNVPVPVARAAGSTLLTESRSGFDVLSPDFPKGLMARLVFWRFHHGAKSPDSSFPKEWMRDCLDAAMNPGGADALFNIPNDADDTALAVALWHHTGRRTAALRPVDAEILAELGRHRDLNRSKEDPRNGWKQKNSGAFLTWLKDESKPVFASPESGVIPLGVNNVDGVVNANVVFALAIAGRKDVPGYADAVRLVQRVAEKRAWQAAALYYPQPLMFPYAASRAFRDGGAREEPMQRAMECLLADLIHLHEACTRGHPRRKGVFPGGADRSEALATALGLAAMLNIGKPTARRLGLETRYDHAVETSVNRLLDLRRTGIAHDRDTIWKTGSIVHSWRAGTVFASSFDDLAHWRSEAQTTAIVLEALARYAAGYDLTSLSDPNPRLCLATHRDGGLGLKIRLR